jgi:hypothetical protein
MTVIDESLTAKGFTPQNQVPLVYGRSRTIDFYTIHWWGSYGQTHDGVNNFFVNGPGLTSAHFTASANRLNCLVNPWDAAWHAGNAYGNAASVGIECRPEGSDGDYATIAELLSFLFDTYGRKPLRPHRYWQATACPGNYDLARLERMALAYKAPVPKPPAIKPKPPTGEVMDLKYVRDNIVAPVSLSANSQVFLKDGGYDWNLAADGLGLGYYDCALFLRGTGLEDGESISVQVFIKTADGNLSGYYPVEIHGSTNGTFEGTIPFKSPLLASASLLVAVKSTTDCVLTNYGADKYVFIK